MFSLPKESQYQDIEDIQPLDIEELFNKFVKPIDAIRSMAKPSIVNSSNLNSINNEFIDLQVSNSEIFESRISAFYRMLGFPVVGDELFYNSGFDPDQTKSFEKKQKIKKNYIKNTDLYNFIQKRENIYFDKIKVFSNFDLKSSIYSILLRHVPQFKLISTNSPFEIDNQNFEILDRKNEIQIIANNNPNIKDKIISFIGYPLTNSNKLLKPFIVDSRINATVMPLEKNICVPFLELKENTQIEKNIYLNRPGIELIIRQRLLNTSTNTLFLKQVENIIKQTKQPGIDTTDLSSFSLIDSLEILSENNKITDNTKNIIKNFTDVQITNINYLTKTIKFLIKDLISSIDEINRSIHEINWLPLPSKDGPITGLVGAKNGFFGVKLFNSSLLEQKMLELKIKKLNAERQIISFNDVGEFASPFYSSNTFENSNSYSDQILELENKKNKISENAFLALKKIEMIVGEIAGIGLIDVLSIYLALWSIDVKTLISFLDDESFDRMYNNISEIRFIPEVAQRKSSGSLMKISDTLKNFENVFANIQSFVDKNFQYYIGNNDILGA